MLQHDDVGSKLESEFSSGAVEFASVPNSCLGPHARETLFRQPSTSPLVGDVASRDLAAKQSFAAGWHCFGCHGPWYSTAMFATSPPPNWRTFSANRSLSIANQVSLQCWIIYPR